MVVASMARTRGILTVLAVGLLVTACGGDSDSSASDGSSSSGSTVTASDLDGSTFQSTSVEGHDLVAGSDVRLTFEDGSLSANAGCNTMSSSYDVTDGRLAWTGPPMATMMGCPDDLMNQDTWLSDLLQAGADATLEGDDLTLVSGDVTLHLQRETTEPAADFLGKTWTVTEIITGSSVASAAGRRHRPHPPGRGRRDGPARHRLQPVAARRSRPRGTPCTFEPAASP